MYRSILHIDLHCVIARNEALSQWPGCIDLLPPTASVLNDVLDSCFVDVMLWRFFKWLPTIQCHIRSVFRKYRGTPVIGYNILVGKLDVLNFVSGKVRPSACGCVCASYEDEPACYRYHTQSSTMILPWHCQAVCDDLPVQAVHLDGVLVGVL